MDAIVSTFEQQGYFKISFRIRKSNHLYIQAKINGVKGLFLLDTGASNTCVDQSEQTTFKLKTSAHKAKASGAGSNDMHTEISKNNLLQMGKWKSANNTLITLDLTHVNIALSQYGLPKIQGIIGSDVLKKHQAVVHYPLRLLFIK